MGWGDGGLSFMAGGWSSVVGVAVPDLSDLRCAYCFCLSFSSSSCL